MKHKSSKKKSHKKSTTNSQSNELEEKVGKYIFNVLWKKFKWWNRINSDGGELIVVFKDNTFEFINVIEKEKFINDTLVKAFIVSGNSSDNLLFFINNILKKYPETLKFTDKQRLDYYISNFGKFFTSPDKEKYSFLKGNSRLNYKLIAKKYNIK